MTKKDDSCEECKKKCRKLYKLDDGRKVCYKCKYRILKESGKLMYKTPKILTEKEALEKEYEVRCGGSEKYVYGVIYANRILIGKKVKLVIVEENKKGENDNGEN